jgi:hypothetical protein
MTTATVFPARRPGALAMLRAASLALTGRLMRLEARRNAMLLMLPPVIVLFWFDTYRTAVWGGPLWWPVAVGAGTVAAACAVGFAAGALLPSRFTAPTVAIVVFALFFATLHPLGASPYSLLRCVSTRRSVPICRP